jgi:cell division protein FtsX
VILDCEALHQPAHSELGSEWAENRVDDGYVLARPRQKATHLHRQLAVRVQKSAVGPRVLLRQGLSFLSTALLVFAFISLFVGAFTIFNTFSIIVGQRTRELALLRIVGASRRQVFRSVLAEAASWESCPRR